LKQPPKKGELRIFNQFVETFSVNELAEKVQRVGSQIGLNSTVQSVKNPRIEAEEHYYNPKHTGLLELGLNPNYLTDEVLAEMIEEVLKHKESIKQGQIYREVKWA
jgi:UDP-sulfoquinovose synthase